MISLFARAERDAKRHQLSDPLELLSRHLDFAAIAAVIDVRLCLGRGAKGGRPASPTQLMIRLKMLLQLYNLPTRRWSTEY